MYLNMFALPAPGVNRGDTIPIPLSIPLKAGRKDAAGGLLLCHLAPGQRAEDLKRSLVYIRSVPRSRTIRGGTMGLAESCHREKIPQVRDDSNSCRRVLRFPNLRTPMCHIVSDASNSDT
jgi:hypothetical protein